MAQVKLALRGMSPLEKIKFAETLEAKITNNPHFASPPLPEVLAAREALNTAYNEAEIKRRESEQLTVAQNTAEVALDKVLTALGSYVESVSQGDVEKILSAGMEIRDEAAPIGTLPAPENFSASDGDLDGEIDLAWNRVRGAASYVIQTSADATTWSGDRVSTKSKYVYGGLPVGVKTWFRVAAVGAAGQGPWSNPAFAMAV